MPTHAIDEARFDEIVRRIPTAKLAIIKSKMEDITTDCIASLHHLLSEQEHLFKEGSFIYDQRFPFVVLKAVQMGEISIHQMATMLTLWGCLGAITLPKITEPMVETGPEYIPLFNGEGARHLPAVALLQDGFSRSLQRMKLPYLIEKKSTKLLDEIYSKAAGLMPSEQGFWLVTKIIPMSSPSSRQCIVREIKKEIGLSYLALDVDSTQEILPSFGLQQAFLDAAFFDPVRLNPVISVSSPMDIRAGSLQRHRDIALPFPGHELPKVADNFSAPSPIEFIFHDRYHAIRASRVSARETEVYVTVGDKLNIIQMHYDAACKRLSDIHQKHRRRLPEFGLALNKLPTDKQRIAIDIARQHFNLEVKMINHIKKVRKSIGQLKFRLWDMEPGYSGSSIDKPKSGSVLIDRHHEFFRIITNIEFNIMSLGQLKNTVAIRLSSGRKIAGILLEILQPNAKFLDLYLECVKRTPLWELLSPGVKGYYKMMIEVVNELKQQEYEALKMELADPLLTPDQRTQRLSIVVFQQAYIFDGSDRCLGHLIQYPSELCHLLSMPELNGEQRFQILTAVQQRLAQLISTSSELSQLLSSTQINTWYRHLILRAVQGKLVKWVTKEEDLKQLLSMPALQSEPMNRDIILASVPHLAPIDSVAKLMARSGSPLLSPSRGPAPAPDTEEQAARTHGCCVVS